MPVFKYKAMQANGAVAEGTLEANGRQEAFRQMEGLGLRPINLSEKSGAAAGTQPGLLASLSGISIGGKSEKISARILENFTRLLSSLLAAGVSLSRALVILYSEASTPAAAASDHNRLRFWAASEKVEMMTAACAASMPKKNR